MEAWRSERDQAAVDAPGRSRQVAGADDENIMPATIAAAKAGATTGSGPPPCARSSAPTGVRPVSAAPPRPVIAVSLTATRRRSTRFQADRPPDSPAGRQTGP